MMPTEILRAMLDERGVEYERTPWSCGTAVWWRDSSGTMWRAHDNEEDELLSFYAYNSVTPEQAIAATLGRGMLTADDVRDLIERHSDASGGNGRDFHNGAYVAIADELNATLGSPNCGAKVIDPTTNDVDAEVEQ